MPMLLEVQTEFIVFLLVGDRLCIQVVDERFTESTSAFLPIDN